MKMLRIMIDARIAMLIIVTFRVVIWSDGVGFTLNNKSKK